MADVKQLPCNGDGICMVCKQKPPHGASLGCDTCGTPWHVTCLAEPPGILPWECPDCRIPADGAAVCRGAGGGDEASDGLIAAVRAIEADLSLTEREKAMRRQRLLSGGAEEEDEEVGEADTKRKGKEKVEEEENDVLKVVGMALNCSFCMQLPERPVTV